MSRRRDLEAEFRRLATTEVLGRTVEWHEELASTNDRAAALAKEGTTEGTLVVADLQTAGRGRMGKTWHSPAAGGLWFSAVLYPTQRLADVARLTLATAEALRGFLKAQFSIVASIKEPNDLLVDGRKICGILAESQSKAGAEHVDFVVVGVGLNLKVAFPDGLRDQATSVAEHTVDPVPPRTALLARLARAMEDRYLI